MLTGKQCVYLFLPGCICLPPLTPRLNGMWFIWYHHIPRETKCYAVVNPNWSWIEGKESLTTCTQARKFYSFTLWGGKGILSGKFLARLVLLHQHFAVEKSDASWTATSKYVVKSAINYHYEFDIAVTSCTWPNN